MNKAKKLPLSDLEQKALESINLWVEHRRKLREDFAELTVEMTEANNAIKELQSWVEKSRKGDKLPKQNKPPKKRVNGLGKKVSAPMVTDHAVLRFLERKLGMDIDAVRDEIVKDITPLIKTFGKGQFPVDGGHKVIVKGSQVITYV